MTTVAARELSTPGFCKPSTNVSEVSLAANLSTDELPEGSGRKFTKECGPHCRPSCITLMLDLDRLLEKHPPMCQTSSNSCHYNPNFPCNPTELFWNHPPCAYEQASCLGPIVSDDKISHLFGDHQALFGYNERCNTFLGDDRARFHGWPVVTPLSPSPSCLGSNTHRLFFKFCNTVGERCNDDCRDTSSCAQGTMCHKLVEPFADGWTTFVVSASVPFHGEEVHCMDSELPPTSGSICWAERVSIYYPRGCPHCHTCPNIGLGDRFGPLEVVGLGATGDHPCSACDNLEARSDDYFSCDTLSQCRWIKDCGTGELLGVPDFVENGYSYSNIFPTAPSGNHVVLDEPLFGEAGRIEDSNDEGFQFDDSASVQVTTKGNDTESPAVRGSIASEMIITSPIGFAMVIVAALLVFRRFSCSQKRKRRTEEIVYVDSAEGEAIEEMLSPTDEDMEVPTNIELNDNSENDTALTPPRPMSSFRARSLRKVRKYYTTSLLESTVKSEVEVLYMEGIHHDRG